MDHLVMMFEQLRARRGGDPLVIGAGAPATVADVDALAGLVAGILDRTGHPSGAPLGLLAPNGPGFLAGLLALLRTHRPAVLLDPLDWPRKIDETLGPLPILRVARGWPRSQADFSVIQPEPGDGGRVPAELPARTAIVKLTSGSAGEPRGVAVTVEALLADDTALRACTRIAHSDRLMGAIPFSHSYGLSSLVIPALAEGVPLVIPDASGPFAPLEAARRFEATVLHTVPAWIAALVRLIETPRLPDSLRLVIAAGSPLSPSAALTFRRRTGRAVHAFYGATECGGIAYDPQGDAGERGTVGEPIPGVKVTLEPEPGLGPGAGRVAVESEAIGLGYVGDDAPFGGRIVTRDLACSDGAGLRLLGRVDDMINVHGRKVRPSEVEQVIAGIAGVEGVVVHAFHDAGAVEPSVRAVVACARGALTGPEILEQCRKRLSAFKVPRSVLFVEELPLTGRGKIDRAAATRLREARSFVHG